MFRTKKETYRLVSEIHEKMCSQEGVIKTLKEVNDDLRKQNKDLMDRFMATNFETFQTFQLLDKEEREIEYDGSGDIDNAGEILEIGR